MLRETRSTTSESSTSLPMHISMSLYNCAPLVHASSTPASHEHSPFKDNRPLICRQRVGKTFYMDIEESHIYVSPIEEVHEDVSPIKETNFLSLLLRRRALRL